MIFSSMQKEILCSMLEHRRFPIVRFELHREGEPELCRIERNYIYLEYPNDSDELIKARSEALQALMEQGVVFIDYTTHTWVQGDYDVYYRSQIYADLCHAVMESSKDPAAIYDLPYMRKGYASFTPVFLQSLPRP
ncbi:MAG: hypothetical protein LKE53_07820 [Oscillospiraceae bacterium]|nr:hypothetical protein [Oscillospiraceae bacterium]MDD3262123.1 hypothetical protein [Oscillospiraceae bacterium]